MIAVDTNVLVRYVTNDDPEQVALAMQLLARPEEIFITKTVILELEWVLRAVYGLQPVIISTAIRYVLGLFNVVVEEPEQVKRALDDFDKGLDFADALHLAASQGAEAFYTFDAKLGKRARGGSIEARQLK